MSELATFTNVVYKYAKFLTRKECEDFSLIATINHVFLLVC